MEPKKLFLTLCCIISCTQAFAYAGWTTTVHNNSDSSVLISAAYDVNEWDPVDIDVANSHGGIYTIAPGANTTFYTEEKYSSWFTEQSITFNLANNVIKFYTLWGSRIADRQAGIVKNYTTNLELKTGGLYALHTGSVSVDMTVNQDANVTLNSINYN